MQACQLAARPARDAVPAARPLQCRGADAQISCGLPQTHPKLRLRGAILSLAIASGAEDFAYKGIVTVERPA